VGSDFSSLSSSLADGVQTVGLGGISGAGEMAGAPLLRGLSTASG
jgi:hypothetical protein